MHRARLTPFQGDSMLRILNLVIIVLLSVIVTSCEEEEHLLSADQNSWISFYDERYDLESVNEQLTNNRGNGFDELYGTRNLREVFPGLVYRGGANNRYHKTNRRSNTNPLPDDGLQNLCEEGFGTAIYLYDKNFETASKTTNCKSIRKDNNELKYVNLRAFRSKEMKSILKMVYENIIDYRHGPMYLHCWNGWHASGQAAALSFKQFCGWSGSKAVKYWVRNAQDGADDTYKVIRNRISNFKPYPEFTISEAQAESFCPE